MSLIYVVGRESDYKWSIKVEHRYLSVEPSSSYSSLETQGRRFKTETGTFFKMGRLVESRGEKEIHFVFVLDTKGNVSFLILDGFVPEKLESLKHERTFIHLDIFNRRIVALCLDGDEYDILFKDGMFYFEKIIPVIYSNIIKKGIEYKNVATKSYITGVFIYEEVK